MAVSTSRLRREYPETIVSSSPLKCDFSDTVRVRYLANSRPYPTGWVGLRIHPALANWSRALASVMLFHKYDFRETAGGSVNCRYIGGSTRTSTHAHAVAKDFNPSVNGYRKSVGPFQWGKYTDMTKQMIADIKAIKTVSGATAVAWGGDWWNVKDPMHYQPDASRYDIELGIDFTTVKGWNEYLVWAEIEEEQMEGFLPIAEGDGKGTRKFKRSDVAAIAAMMERAYGIDLNNDGVYGDRMVAAVKTHLGGNGKAVYGNLYDDLIWNVAIAAAKKVSADQSGGLKFEVETVSVVKGIKGL